LVVVEVTRLTQTGIGRDGIQILEELDIDISRFQYTFFR
jgi:hypothetical protein